MMLKGSNFRFRILRSFAVGAASHDTAPTRTPIASVLLPAAAGRRCRRRMRGHSVTQARSPSPPLRGPSPRCGGARGHNGECHQGLNDAHRAVYAASNDRVLCHLRSGSAERSLRVRNRGGRFANPRRRPCRPQDDGTVHSIVNGASRQSRAPDLERSAGAE